MIQGMIRRFIPHSEKTDDQTVREAYGTLGSLTGMGLNLFLSLVKILMGIFSGSVAIAADGFNNLSDAGGSLISLISVRMAQRPRDEKHPFGHGRIEYLGALAVGLLIGYFGLELLFTGIKRIFAPSPAEFSWLTVAFLTVSMGLKLWMARFYRILGEKSQQLPLLAAAKDSLSDVFSTLAVLLSALLSLCFGLAMDGLIGTAVSLLVLKAAWDVLKDTVSRLLGGQPDRALGKKIVEMLLSRPEILGVHDLVLHDYGPGRAMASVHAEVPSDSSLIAIHDVIDAAEREITKELQIPICIHMDPVETNDPKTETAKGQMETFLSSLKPPLRLHDFHRIPGKSHINLIFDVLLPDENIDPAPIEAKIAAYAQGLDQRYRCIVHFDRDYFDYNGSNPAAPSK